MWRLHLKQELSYCSGPTLGSKPSKERKLCGQRSDSARATFCPAHGLEWAPTPSYPNPNLGFADSAPQLPPGEL